ncbi:hypothetical protein HZH66_007334 [Vespula vulgaris]|uniref:Uncharacterized protein n=1 Tax=Vespula vulgaris TaxID=7454 RepID=A0A834JXX2_VESVU|nr:hypothetical protein HZH66_007334 [Vespula vulgaris]
MQSTQLPTECFGTPLRMLPSWNVAQPITGFVCFLFLQKSRLFEPGYLSTQLRGPSTARKSGKNLRMGLRMGSITLRSFAFCAGHSRTLADSMGAHAPPL